MGTGLVSELHYHFAPLANQSLLPLKVHPKPAELLCQAFHRVTFLQSLLASPLQCCYLGPQVTLDGLQLLFGQPQLIFSDLHVLSGLLFVILGLCPRHRSMLQVRPVLHELLSKVPYLGLKASPLGGQGSNLSLVSIHHPGGALSKAGPPCQAFRVSNHLPKNKKSANRTETIKKKIDENTWMYRSGSLKQKSQSLLDGQGIHLLDVEVEKDGGNNPSNEFRMREQRVLTPCSLKAIVIPRHLIRQCRRGRDASRRGTLNRNRKNLQGGLSRPPRRVSSLDSGRRRGRGSHF